MGVGAVSGGGRRGEVRIRKASPTPKSAGGTHNRKARRAAKAQQAALPLPPFDESKWHASYERRRAERKAYWASKTDADFEEMRLTESAALAWDPLFRALLLEAIPLWVRRHHRTDPDARVRRAHELGENIVCASQAIAALCDSDARGTEQKGSMTEAFNAIAEGLAIGAYCPEGATFIGVNWAVVGDALRTTHLTHCTAELIDALPSVSGDLGPTIFRCLSATTQ